MHAARMKRASLLKVVLVITLPKNEGWIGGIWRKAKQAL
jgi:hypothetical protein